MTRMEKIGAKARVLFVLSLVSATCCAAETITYSVPVLTVMTDGDEVVKGGGRLTRCPFTYVSTTNDAPVKVMISEDIPVGVGNEHRASLWLATTTASLILNRSLTGVMVSLETTGYVDGPSAGGMFCLAVMSAMEGRPFPGDFAMTGTIMADGTIGAVGGIGEKLRAASKAGITRVCIPTFSRMDDDFTDLLDLGKELKLEVHQVATIGEAYQILHKLPERHILRLNPTEICRIPAHVETVMKDVFASSMLDGKGGLALPDEQTGKPLCDLQAGLFGAAIMDLLQAHENHTYDVRKQEVMKMIEEVYPALKDEYVEGASDRDAYIATLKKFHKDMLDVVDGGASDDAEIVDEDDETEAPPAVGADDTDAEKAWLDDYVKSPCAAQFAALGSFFWSKIYVTDMACSYVTKMIDSIEDWDTMAAGRINDARTALIEKLALRAYTETLNEGAAMYEKWDGVLIVLHASMPYMRPNGNVRQTKGMLYRTMVSMRATLMDAGLLDEQDVSAYETRHLLDLAEAGYGVATNELLDVESAFLSVDAISDACGLLLRQATRSGTSGGGHASFFNSVVSTARENALLNIAECRRRGIACVMPVISFQHAESLRDDYSAEDDPDDHRFEVFTSYLRASLSSKVLMLCFSGQKPELNEKGYCSKLVTRGDNSSTTFRYLGVDGEPILRGSYSGYRIGKEDGVAYLAWLDLEGRDVRHYTTNECYTLAYDASGRHTRKTYCSEAWVPTPREDGVLFVDFDFDGNGCQTELTFLSATSNRVVSADGMASVKYSYNKGGNKTRQRYYGVRGEPVVHRDGNAGIDFAYDKKGNQRRFTYVDLDGKPVMTTHGFARAEYEYDADGNRVGTKYFDADGRPVKTDE